MTHKNNNSEHMFLDYSLNGDGYDGAHLLTLAAHRLLDPRTQAVRADITVIDEDGDIQRTVIDLDRTIKKISMTELNLNHDHKDFASTREDIFSQPLRKSQHVEEVLRIVSTGNSSH